jgi:hypothetical protein
MRAMQRAHLLPSTHLPERLLLLDLLAGKVPEGVFGRDVDADAFLEVTPGKVMPLLHANLSSIGKGFEVPQAVRDVLAHQYLRNNLLFLRRSADLRRLESALRGIPYLVLKGPVLAALVYPNPGARTMTDLDLLVHPDQMGDAVEALKAIGYVTPLQFAGSEMPAGDGPPLITGVPGSPEVELHAMLDSAPDDRLIFERVVCDARRVDLGNGVVVSALSRPEFFIHVVAHVSRHHRFEGELRSLVDVLLLLRSKETEFDWESAAREWDARGLLKWVDLTLHLVAALFDVQVPEFFRDRVPSDEAMQLAAAQLWASKSDRVPSRIVHAMAKRAPSPVHASHPPEAVPIPAGFTGVLARVERQKDKVTRVFDAWRRGMLRRDALAETVDLFVKREQLFDLLENEQPERQAVTPVSRRESDAG